MKKINFLILGFLTIGCVNTSSDDRKNKTEQADTANNAREIVGLDTVADYKSFNNFKSDTLAYLKYNFKKRKAAYINKKLKFLLKDFELSVVEYTIAPWSTKHPELLQSLGLYFEGSSVSYRKFNNHIPPNGLFIKLKTPMGFETAKKLKKESNNQWEAPVIDYYGEIEIEDIGISNTKD